MNFCTVGNVCLSFLGNLFRLPSALVVAGRGHVEFLEGVVW